MAGPGHGGGGGSGAHSVVIVPAFLIPDVLFIRVGAGGAGGTPGNPGTTGGSGILSHVSIHPGVTPSNILAVSGEAGPTGGVGGTNLAEGAGGAAGTVALITSMPLASRGVFSMFAGQAGKSGFTAGTIPTDGAVAMGGGGVPGNFAQITAISESWLSQQRHDHSGTKFIPGPGGTPIWKPFHSFPGMAGAYHDGASGPVPNGGNGVNGSGGGGGGAGAGANAGNGGYGGGGVVMIACF